MNLVLKVVLLTALSSKMPNNAAFQAKITNACQPEAAVAQPRLAVETPVADLPCAENGVLTGRVVARRAGWFHRRGTIRLVIDDSRFAIGEQEVTNLKSTFAKVDSEGTISRRASWKRRILSFAIAGGIMKVADDSVDWWALSTAGARHFAWIAGAAWLVVERGQDVRLPAGTVIEVSDTESRQSSGPVASFGSASAR